MDRLPLALADYNGQLVLGGDFTYINGLKVNGIARWSGSQWGPVADGVSGGKDSSQVKALVAYQGELVTGGNFTSAGGVKARNIARWNGSTWTTVGEGFNAPVDALAIYNGELIAGGRFTASGETTVNGIARWDGTGWMPLGSGVSGTWSPGVHALAVFGGELYAGGLFVKAGSDTVNHIARWDGAEWRSVGGGMSGSGYPDVPVAALTVRGGDLIAGGLFTNAGGATAANIARWDGTEWYAIEAENSAGPRQVHALMVYAGQLIAGGVFSGEGLLSTDGLARWDGTEWTPLGRGVGGGTVFALAAYRGELVAGGSFLTAGVRTSARLAYWAPTEPTAIVRQWRSIRYHEGSVGGELAITLDSAATTGERIVTETRQGGIQKIVIEITGPRNGELAIEGRVMAEEVGATGYAYAASLQTLTHNEGGSYTLVAEWPEGLPDQRCYRIDLGANIACLKGDTDCLVRSLTADVTGDGLVDSNDMVQAKSRISTPVMPDNTAFDVNIDGALNATDVMTIRAFQDRAIMSP